MQKIKRVCGALEHCATNPGGSGEHEDQKDPGRRLEDETECTEEDAMLGLAGY